MVWDMLSLIREEVLNVCNQKETGWRSRRQRMVAPVKRHAYVSVHRHEPVSYLGPSDSKFYGEDAPLLLQAHKAH